jgi:homoserine O-acetyltransferase
MGAQQAFQWAVSYPTFADRIVATSGTAKTYGHGIVRLEGQLAALMADPEFNGGDYTSRRRRARGVRYRLGGVAVLAGVVAPRALEVAAPPGTTLEQYIKAFRRGSPAQRREQPDPAGAHVGAARRGRSRRLRR